MELVLAFINADNWDESRRIVEENSERLLSDEADAVFALLLEQYKGNEKATRILELHRTLLRRCREIGIAAAFEELLRALAQQRIEPATAQPLTLDQIAEKTIAVMTRDQGDKAKWWNAVRDMRLQADEAGDQQMVALMDAISRLLLGDRPANISVDLEGPYAACWARIVEGIRGGG